MRKIFNSPILNHLQRNNLYMQTKYLRKLNYNCNKDFCVKLTDEKKLNSGTEKSKTYIDNIEQVYSKTKEIEFLISKVSETQDKIHQLHLQKHLTKHYFPSLHEHYNLYNKTLDNSMISYYDYKFNLNRRRYLFYLIASFLLMLLYKTIKWYYILYYYFMYDIDIRQPVVSDYILTRYR